MFAKIYYFCAMRFLTADYLYPLCTVPIKKGVLQVTDEGEILAVFEHRSEAPQEKLEIFKGILCPGFVNVHCHLELSHLLGKAEKGKGFLDFVAAIQQRNECTKEEIQVAIEKAEQQMIANGIVAVGDICNTNDTLLQKQKANLEYYNFIETFAVHEDRIDAVFSQAMELREEFRNAGQQATIVPHAPYSVPPRLMCKIGTSFDEKDAILSIHNQETKEENELFIAKSGKFSTWLKSINASSSIWLDRDKSTDILQELGDNKILLVHNTFTKKEELTGNYYCTCPKANLYIENALPDYSIFDTDKLCVGTDSLASNDSLSILEELLVVQENTNFDMNTLLKIASKNGAEALGFENLGTFEKGKIPGVNLVVELSKITKLV
jgi:cytosine/adenosine deaminase-related metal-dependent hydrolase